MDFVSTHNAREMYSRAGWTVAFAAVLYFINRAEYPGPAALLAVVLVLIAAALAGIGYGLHWLATEGQRRVHAEILDSLQLQGAERVLSLSHDLGIEAAKRLKSGKVISLGDTASNEVARETAKTAGLADRIRFEPGDPASKLSYPDANFDIVLVGRSSDLSGSPAAHAELLRVLKPGARLLAHSTTGFGALRQFPSCVISPTGLPLGLGGQICTVPKPQN